MDARHLDDLAREIGSRLPRRSVLGALGGLAALLAAPVIEGDAKKKKKKCKGGKRKCGKKCILADQCCTSADCGVRGNCVSSACECPSGQKPCNGGCIPEASCCQNSECGDGTICSGGACVCPVGTKPCLGSCISADTCCFSACPAGLDCLDNFCVCEQEGAVTCGETCCSGEDAICEITEAFTCTGGGCKLLDWCNSTANAVCREDPNSFCVCITAYSPEAVPACVDGIALGTGDTCDSCEESVDCGEGFVCVAGDVNDQGFCGCSGRFCAPLCDTAPERAIQRANTEGTRTAHKKKPGSTRERRTR